MKGNRNAKNAKTFKRKVNELIKVINCLYGILVYHEDILQVFWMLFDQSLTKYVIS